MQVNAYNSVHVVDSLYRSKYFLTSVDDSATQHLKWERKAKGETTPLNLNNQKENSAASEDKNNANENEVHRVTILNRPEDVVDPSSEILADNKITGYQHSESASRKVKIVENPECLYTDSQICRPLLPWMNGDGTVNEHLYKGLLRRALGIVVLHPGILEVCYPLHSCLYFLLHFYAIIRSSEASGILRYVHYFDNYTFIFQIAGKLQAHIPSGFL